MAWDVRMASIIGCRESPLRRLDFVVTASALVGKGRPQSRDFSLHWSADYNAENTYILLSGRADKAGTRQQAFHDAVELFELLGRQSLEEIPLESEREFRNLIVQCLAIF